MCFPFRTQRQKEIDWGPTAAPQLAEMNTTIAPWVDCASGNCYGDLNIQAVSVSHLLSEVSRTTISPQEVRTDPATHLVGKAAVIELIFAPLIPQWETASVSSIKGQSQVRQADSPSYSRANGVSKSSSLNIVVQWGPCVRKHGCLNWTHIQ